MCVTHWILNYKFMNYGMQVMEYVTYYGRRGKFNMHDPMCELFPTEVNKINIKQPLKIILIKENVSIISQNGDLQQKFGIKTISFIILGYVPIKSCP